VLAAVLWPRRHRLGPSARSLFVARRRVWVPVVLISVVFALPIAVNLALHWPGPFGQYLAYASSKKAGGHTMVQAVRLALWYWWPYRYAWVVPVAGYAVAIAVTRWLAPARLCGFLIALLAVNAVSSLVFLYYVLTGVGVLNEQYVGYFYWSAPLVTLLVIVLGLVEAMPARLGAAVALGTAVLALAGLAVAPQARTSTNSSDPAVLASGPDTDRALPAMVSALAARAGGRMIVLRFDQQTWPDITGFLVQAERTGVRACVANPDLDVHDDQPVHLHQRGNLGRPGVLVRPLRAPQRDHRPAQASRGHGRPGSSYWESNVVTLTSGDQVQIRTVSVSGGRLTASHLESKAQWYDPRLATANFVVLFPGVPGYSGFTNERAMLATFGRPARTYRVGSYTILIWHRNLLSELR
jgi:hypothetical protein